MGDVVEFKNTGAKLSACITNKKQYHTIDQAKLARGKFSALRGGWIAMDIYECPTCRTFHLGHRVSGKRLFELVRKDLERPNDM